MNWINQWSSASWDCDWSQLEMQEPEFLDQKCKTFYSRNLCDWNTAGWTTHSSRPIRTQTTIQYLKFLGVRRRKTLLDLKLLLLWKYSLVLQFFTAFLCLALHPVWNLRQHVRRWREGVPASPAPTANCSRPSPVVGGRGSGARVSCLREINGDVRQTVCRRSSFPSSSSSFPSPSSCHPVKVRGHSGTNHLIQVNWVSSNWSSAAATATTLSQLEARYRITPEQPLKSEKENENMPR